MKPLACLIPMLVLLAGAHAQETRVDFLKLIDRPRVALDATVADPKPDGALQQFRFSFASDTSSRVPGIVLKPTSSTGKMPVVIALHGTGGNKESELPLMRDLAAKGFIAVAMDARYHGERTKAGKGSAEYQDAILRAFREQREHPFFYDTVWDVMRLIDYLGTRDDVDATRIGLFGVSKGGIETYLAAAVDPRIACAVPCIGVESFRWAIENDAWHSRIGTIQSAFDNAAKESKVEHPGAEFVKQFYDRVAPGLAGEFDGPAMLPLIAPRPLLVINGDSDPRTPLPGLSQCTDAAEKAYREAHAEDHFVVRIQEHTAHKVTPESQQAAVEWFVRWLKPDISNAR
jgi:dienelactone hydrolase